MAIALRSYNEVVAYAVDFFERKTLHLIELLDSVGQAAVFAPRHVQQASYGWSASEEVRHLP